MKFEQRLGLANFHDDDTLHIVVWCVNRISKERTKHHIVLAKEKGYHHLEWTLRRLSDGTSFPAEVRLTAMTLKGKPILQATILDITDRKRVDRMKNEFVSTVSHELRIPPHLH